LAFSSAEKASRPSPWKILGAASAGTARCATYGLGILSDLNSDETEG
jgi:hypothetical protein